MPADRDGLASGEWRQHWPLVCAACAGMAMSTLIPYSTGLFIDPLQHAFGWSRAQITSGQVIAAPAGALLGPLVGGLIDRIGPRRIGITACILMCLTTTLLGLTSSNIWVWRALWMPLAGAIVLIQPTVWTSAITGVFVTGRGLALAVTLCGSSIASLITPPLTYALIEKFGWRMAYLVLPAVWAILVIPIVMLFFVTPKDRIRKHDRAHALGYRQATWRAVRQDVLTPRFARLAAAGLCIALIVVTLAVSLVPLLSSYGLPRKQAAGIAALLGFASIFGRLTIGLLLDRVPGRFIAAFCVCLPMLGIAILLATSASALAASAAVLIFGLCLGAELDILAYLTSRYFSRDHFGLLFGVIGGLVGIGGGIGPIVFSAVFDRTHSYIPALWSGIPVCLVSAMLFLTLGRYPAAPDEAAGT